MQQSSNFMFNGIWDLYCDVKRSLYHALNRKRADATILCRVTRTLYAPVIHIHYTYVYA